MLFIALLYCVELIIIYSIWNKFNINNLFEMLLLCIMIPFYGFCGVLSGFCFEKKKSIILTVSTFCIYFGICCYVNLNISFITINIILNIILNIIFIVIDVLMLWIVRNKIIKTNI